MTEAPFGPAGSTSGADGSIAGSHVYADNGVYTVTVTVTDDGMNPDNQSDFETFTVSVAEVNAAIDVTAAGYEPFRASAALRSRPCAAERVSARIR